MDAEAVTDFVDFTFQGGLCGSVLVRHLSYKDIFQASMQLVPALFARWSRAGLGGEASARRTGASGEELAPMNMSYHSG